MQTTIELRSDTFTKPTAGMLEAMWSAQVGDDVFGEDPTVRALEERLAEMFGMEAGLFCASGTMSNQLAIKAHTQSPGELICDELAHIYNYEGGGIAFHSGLSIKLTKGERGCMSAEQVAACINAEDIHFPSTQLVCLENTCNKGGGSIYTLESIQAIRELCQANGLPLHLDGARLFNALVATGQRPEQHGALFESISICLSKGLGCPVGSVLLGSKPFIAKARKLRKLMGGGMRQAGYLAAAGLYALEHHIERLADDHRRAKELYEVLQACSWVEKAYEPQTNILLFEVKDYDRAKEVTAALRAQGIMVSNFWGNKMRMVTHLDFGDEQMEPLCRALKGL